MWKKIFQQRMSEKNELETLREQLENLKEQARAFTIIVKISIRISKNYFSQIHLFESQFLS